MAHLRLGLAGLRAFLATKDHHLGGIGQSQAAELPPVPPDARGEEALVIGALPLPQATIGLTHGT